MTLLFVRQPDICFFRFRAVDLLTVHHQATLYFHHAGCFSSPKRRWLAAKHGPHARLVRPDQHPSLYPHCPLRPLHSLRIRLPCSSSRRSSSQTSTPTATRTSFRRRFISWWLQLGCTSSCQCSNPKSRVSSSPGSGANIAAFLATRLFRSCFWYGWIHDRSR